MSIDVVTIIRVAQLHFKFIAMSLMARLFGIEVKENVKDGKTFYHYTSRNAAISIARERVIKKKRNGVLLTTMEPDRYYRTEILFNNYGDNAADYLRNRADHCVRVHSSKLTATKLKKTQMPSGRLIYWYDDDIQVNAADVFDKPTCNRSVQATQSEVHQSTAKPSSKLEEDVQKSTSSSSSSLMEEEMQQSPSSCLSSRPEKHVQHSALSFSSSQLDKDLQQSTASSSSSQKPFHFDVKQPSDVASGVKSKSSKMNEIKINLRRDIQLCHAHKYQDENVTIFAFEWMKEGLKRIRSSIDGDTFVTVVGDSNERHILSGDWSLKDLQMVARNESSNTNGVIDFANYSGIGKDVIYALKDLNRQTVIIGKDRTAYYDGYPHGNKRVPQSESVYVCDLIGLQFQQQYNSGRLVLVGEHLPIGLLDEFIYEQVVKEKKPTMDDVRSDYSGRFVESGIALNQCATEPLNFKFLKYGTGYFAGPFRQLLDRFIGQGVAEGLNNLLTILPENHRIKRVELPFFDPNPNIAHVCSKHDIELKYSTDDALKDTRWIYTTATTNSADPHSMTGNKMGFGSVDGAIAENLNGKAVKYSAVINKAMKECFVKN